MIKTLAFAAVAVFSLNLASTSSSADDGQFAKKHPRRAQVNHRNNKQNKRIDNAAANGKLTQGQANQDLKQEQGIRNQEKADAAANGGHITQGQQKQLNQEENHMNNKINNQEARDANHPAGGAAPAAPAAAAPPAGQ